MPKANSKEKQRFAEKLAKHIQSVRRKSKTKVTQEELAGRAGLNSAYIGHLERGVYTPTFYVVWKIAKALKMNLEEFVKGFDP